MYTFWKMLFGIHAIVHFTKKTHYVFKGTNKAAAMDFQQKFLYLPAIC